MDFHPLCRERRPDLASRDVSAANATRRGNVIFWHLERPEQQSLRIFNERYPNRMPYRLRLVNATTALNGYVMNAAEWFTMVSVFTQQPGLLGFSTTN
jgi:hypothetical protein